MIKYIYIYNYSLNVNANSIQIYNCFFPLVRTLFTLIYTICVNISSYVNINQETAILSTALVLSLFVMNYLSKVCISSAISTEFGCKRSVALEQSSAFVLKRRAGLSQKRYNSLMAKFKGH